MENTPLVAPAQTPAQTPESDAAPTYSALSWTERVTHFGKGKEALLLVAGVQFLLGYFSIAYTARQYHLGFVPPLQTQCILAGFLPVVGLAAFFLMLVGLFRLEAPLITWLKAKTAKARRRLAWGVALGIPFVGGCLYLVAAHRTLPLLFTLYLYLGLFLGLFYYSLHDRSSPTLLEELREYESGPFRESETGDEVRLFPLLTPLARWVWKNKEGIDAFQQILKNAGRWLAYLPLVFLFCATVVFWVGFVYPRLPQEYGGMQPRVAHLALTRAQLTPELRGVLLPKGQDTLPPDIAKDPLAVAQSTTLDVLYENSEMMVVRTHYKVTPIDRATPKVFQIKKSSIQGVTWDGYNERP